MDGAIDIDTYLQGYDEPLELLDLAGCHYVGRQAIPGPNWKVAYDGYLDLYHLPILHKDSFGPTVSNKASYDAWGPHQMVTSPSGRAEPYEHLPADEWPLGACFGGLLTIFPHVSIATFDAGGKLYMISQLFPGSDPDTSITYQNFLSPEPLDDERRQVVKDQMAFLEHVVRDEDYYTGNRIQRVVKTGAKDTFMFGRNEGGGQRFHRWVDAIVDADDVELPTLFKTGIDD